MDYDILPTNDLVNGSFINGRFVPINDLVNVSAKLGEAVMLPEAFVGNPSVGVAHFWESPQDRRQRLKDELNKQLAAVGKLERESSPLDWALTQTNVGHALLELGIEEDSITLLNQAFSTLCSGLEELARDQRPKEWAIAKASAGRVLLALALRDLSCGHQEGGVALLREAVAAFHSSLEELTRWRSPSDWAMVTG